MILVHAAGLVLVGFVAAFGALLAFSFGPARPTTLPRRDDAAEEDGIVFLFDNGALVDTSSLADSLIDDLGLHETAIQAVVRGLERTFPGIGKSVENAEIPSACGQFRASIVSDRQRTRLSLSAPNSTAPLSQLVRSIVRAELTALKTFADDLPIPVWHQSTDGNVTFSNRVYRETTRDAGNGLVDGVTSGKNDPSNETPTICLHPAGMTVPSWFELHRSEGPAGRVCAAIPVDRAIRQQKQLDAFVQTMTQTFAQLRVALVIFDRDGRLAVFNPAFVDMFGVRPEILIGQPLLVDLFDRLREARSVPEQKDYKMWRDGIARLLGAQGTAEFHEDWPLSDGRTFRVAGRPFPNGSFAFVFEDISDELSLQAGLSARLRLGQAVLDGIAEAVAVFDPGGRLVLKNDAYRRLWPDAPSDLVTSVHRWRSVFGPSEAWAAVQRHASVAQMATLAETGLRHRDGTPLVFRFHRLTGGHMLAGFREMAVIEPGVREPKRATA